MNITYSKFLSLVLRHKPEEIGLQLDENGWANVQELIEKANKKNVALSIELVEEIVEKNDKKRFSFNEDHSRIRAVQGHSIEVDLQLEEKVPPVFLYHGTAVKSLQNIRSEGLKKMNRQHVHLSSTEEQARKVGMRHGKPVVLLIESLKMHTCLKFFLSQNNVWLTDHVPIQYIIEERNK